MGRFTLPIDQIDDEQLKEIIKRWDADAIRDSDGTAYSEELLALGLKVYRTYLTTRNDQEFAMSNPDQVQQLYVTSEPVIATSATCDIQIMKGIFEEQFKVNDTAYQTYWEVRDRTKNQTLKTSAWTYDSKTKCVKLLNAIPYHEYTVSFLVYQIWDPTQMYNHLTNDWGDRHHEIPYDMRHEKTTAHVLAYLENWLAENDEVDVVRFTTFFYHFTLIYNEMKKEKFVDWFGYSSSLSHEAIEAFNLEKGYALKAEDIIDEGYYNSPFRIPSAVFLDFIDFQSKFVCEQAKKMVDLVHKKGKEAMMFLGDNWIGTEPYGPYFEQLNIDAVVGSVGNGTTLRMISDIPHVKYTEGRFLPYFFPDVFCEAGDPVGEAIQNWIQGRRAILQSPIDRMGYGGYLSLALKFPEFVSTVENIQKEFNTFHELTQKTKPHRASFKVAILNCWGRLRSWQTNQVAHALHYDETYSYVGILEALSGLPFEIEFLSFEDIKRGGISSDIGVIINAGDAMTAFSGGENWLDEQVITTIREWVYNGGGFIGVGEPTAIQNQGKYFQLFDVLGVDKEMMYSLSYRKYHELTTSHFMTEDVCEPLDFGRGIKGVFQKSDQTQILAMDGNDILLSSHEVGQGRGVYIAGLPYTSQNARLLTRAIYFAAKKEDALKTYYVSHVDTECVYYPSVNQLAIYNNSLSDVTTTLYVNNEISQEITLKGAQMIWLTLAL